jgi:serine protease Do
MNNKKASKKFFSLFFLFSCVVLSAESKLIHENSKLNLKTKTKSISNLNNDLLIWSSIRENCKDCVVQLFVQVSEFNWTEPFKSPRQYEASGTGFFIDNEGYLISNYHVVEEKSGVQIQISSFGKKRFDVDVVGVCPQRDIALLKLNKKSFDTIVKKLGSLPSLKLGNSDEVLSVSDVLVLGYPLGQEKLKITKGIVSGREFLSDDPFTQGDSYIQIDAAINSGNSGGPCLNSKGEVIGINTASYSRAENVGYIIPINDVKNVISELKTVKLKRKPFLGVKFGNASGDIVNFLKNKNIKGWYVSRVYKDTILQKAGVNEGDILSEFNGYKVDMFGEIDVDWSEGKVSLFDFLNRLASNEEIKIVIYRNGEEKRINFKLNNCKPLPIRTIYSEYEKVKYEIIGGMVVMELTLNHVGYLLDENPYLVKYYKREKQYKPRLILTHIIPNSQTQKSRTLCCGELLDEVNGKSINTLDGFRTAVKKSTGDGFLSVKTKSKSFMVLAVEKIIKEEDKLAKEYVFKKSELVKYLSENYKINRNVNGS